MEMTKHFWSFQKCFSPSP